MRKVLTLAVGATLMCGVPSALWAQTKKPVVAVYKIEDLTNSGSSQTFSTMIETAVESTSKFRVIEREHLATLVGEQARAKAGLVTSNTPGKVGGFEGADYLIYGTITTLSVTGKADFGSSLLAGMLAGQNRQAPTCGNLYATLGVDIKITDASTGEVRYVTRINETQKSATTCGGQAQIDKAVLMRSAADKVATALVTTIYPIQIAAVQGDGVLVLNYGEGAVQPGAIFGVYAKGDVIRDPASGEVIASNETKLGFIKVTEVTGRVSRAATISQFAAAPQIGAIVRPASAEDVQALSKQQRR
ncbi:MAG TPA: CsgG/HfaB family protein [Caulobacteraceae bacterium]|jgi:curli biogenesis system outer membrane secretion channel CsgG|nr:CsgG/HfaB family protein [Caulobacteraceae bacterium]